MRTISLLLLAGLAACGRGEAPDAHQRQDAAPGAAAASDPRIECASGSAPFERACTVEETAGEGGTTLVLRKPDGGFRRLLVTADGRGVVAADGAQPAAVHPVGDRLIEVTVGTDRFRLPATVKPGA